MKMKKIAALSLATVMTLGLSATAFAQTAAPTTPDADNAKITIANASKGEKYTIYQLFNATVTDDKSDDEAGNGSIAYQLMAGKTDAGPYFEVDASGNVHAKATTTEDVLKSDEFKAWAAGYGTALVSNVESDGSALDFTGLPYGYYYVTTTQGSNITVDSTNPNVTVYDKNTTTPTIDEEEGKVVDNENVTVGQTVTYTVTFTASNFEGSGEDAKRIVSYKIKDTLPEFLDPAVVTSVVIDNDAQWNDACKDKEGDLVTLADMKFDENGEIEIAWVDAEGNSLYDNGAQIKITYTAVVNELVKIGADNENKNEVTLSYKTTDPEDPDDPYKEVDTVDESIYSYALAIQKVDENKAPLAGATFLVKGVKNVISLNKDADGKDLGGHYKVATADAEGVITAAADAEGVELKCDANGYLILEGVASGSYTVSEVQAPNGYNKLTTDVTVIAQEIGSTESKTTTVIWKDANGNIISEEEKTETSTEVKIGTNELEAYALTVVNQKGNELPSTGGIGTTIFYVVGGILVVGAGVVLVAKKRMNHEA